MQIDSCTHTHMLSALICIPYTNKETSFVHLKNIEDLSTY